MLLVPFLRDSFGCTDTGPSKNNRHVLIGRNSVVENAFFSHEVAFFWHKTQTNHLKGYSNAIRFRIVLQNKINQTK